MTRSALLLLAVAVLAAPALAGAGTITVKGSDTMVILAQRWAEAYVASHPGTKVQVTGGGTGTGIAALLNGTTDLATASRRMNGAERQRLLARAKVEAKETPVAKDGVVFYVHPANPVDTLTLAQLRAIYLGDVVNWNEVGGPDAKIAVYARESSSGTYAYVKEALLQDQDYAARALMLPGTAAVVHAISLERWGIGFGGAAYAKGVKELKVATGPGEPGVAPTQESVRKGTYPLSRDLLVYTRGEPRGEAAEFLRWVVSPEGQAVAERTGFYPLR